VDCEGVVMVLQLAKRVALWFVASEVKGEEVEEECKVGDDVLERCVDNAE